MSPQNDTTQGNHDLLVRIDERQIQQNLVLERIRKDIENHEVKLNLLEKRFDAILNKWLGISTVLVALGSIVTLVVGKFIGKFWP